MKIGLIGAGNIACALARGWGEPVLCSDRGSGRAQALADELGGARAASNRELASRVDLVVLCHKPAQLTEVAAELADGARAVASVLAGVSTAALQHAFPSADVFALMPNTPVEIRRGVVLYAQAPRTPRSAGETAGGGAWEVADATEAAVLKLFGRLGQVVTVPERLMSVAMGISGVGPAYQALLAEAQVDAAVRHGLGAALAAELVNTTVAGSAALLAVRGHDTLAVRRAVTSPGGSTARGLDALERAGVRRAFQDALDAVAGDPAKARR